MTANKMPEMPEANVRFVALTHDIHFADSVEVPGETLDLYTADHLLTYGRESAAFGFSQGFDAGYLAGLEAARQAVPTYASPDYASPFSPPYAEGHEDGFGDCRDATLTNLTALEQEAKKCTS